MDYSSHPLDAAFPDKVYNLFFASDAQGPVV